LVWVGVVILGWGGGATPQTGTFEPLLAAEIA